MKIKNIWNHHLVWLCLQPTVTFPVASAPSSHCPGSLPISRPESAHNFGSPPLTKWKYIYIQKITKTCNAMIYIIYICYNKKIYAYHRYSKVMKERCVASLHVHPQPSSWYLSSMYTYMMPKCIAPQNISGRLSAVYEFMGKATFWPSKYFRTSTRRLQSHPQIHLGFIFIMYLFKCI